MIRRLGSIGMRYPFAVSVGVATVKTGSADLVVQRYVEKKKHIDWNRTISFSVFGFVFLGIVQWFIYVPGYRLVFKEMDKFCQQTIKQKLRNRAGLKDLAGYALSSSRIFFVLNLFTHKQNWQTNLCRSICGTTADVFSHVLHLQRNYYGRVWVFKTSRLETRILCCDEKICRHILDWQRRHAVVLGTCRYCNLLSTYLDSIAIESHNFLHMDCCIKCLSRGIQLICR